MNASEVFVGQRVVVNNNLGLAHKDRLVPGMVGTVSVAHDNGCVVIFDTPFMKIFHNSWDTCGVNVERLDPAPEGAQGTIIKDA